jgi:sodium/potassium-transporting ATPase subunit alpha
VRRWQLVIAHCLSASQLTDLFPINEEEGDAESWAYCVMMKGAPEVILNRCSHVSIDGQVKKIDDGFRKQCQVGILWSRLPKVTLFPLQHAWEFFGNEGRLVIGFAHKYFRAVQRERFSANSDNYPQDGLVFLGMSAIMDPPRVETSAAIRQCKEAGVKVFMITGDHPTTASAIATQIGLFSKKPSKVKSNLNFYALFSRTKNRRRKKNADL